MASLTVPKEDVRSKLAVARQAIRRKSPSKPTQRRQRQQASTPCAVETRPIFKPGSSPVHLRSRRFTSPRCCPIQCPRRPSSSSLLWYSRGLGISADADVVHAVVGGCLVEELGAVATQIGCDEVGYLSIAPSVVEGCGR
jgi:hypothetical protein